MWTQTCADCGHWRKSILSSGRRRPSSCEGKVQACVCLHLRHWNRYSGRRGQPAEQSRRRAVKRTLHAECRRHSSWAAGNNFPVMSTQEFNGAEEIPKANCIQPFCFDLVEHQRDNSCFPTSRANFRDDLGVGELSSSGKILNTGILTLFFALLFLFQFWSHLIRMYHYALSSAILSCSQLCLKA